MTLTRRSALRYGLGGAGLAALAGCLSEPGGDADDGNGGNGEGTPHAGYAAFFALHDWADQVGGDAFEFENPVGVGEVGHGWEPDQGLTREVADTDVFVYLDSPEFGWAQDVASQLEADYDDIAAIDAMVGLEGELLPWDGGHDHKQGEGNGEEDHDDHDENGEDDHDGEVADDFGEGNEIGTLEIVDRRTDEVVADAHGDHWHGGLPEIPAGGEVAFDAGFEDGEGRSIPLEDGREVGAEVLEGAQEGVVGLSGGDHLVLEGKETGRTEITIVLQDGEDVLWESEPLSVRVTDEAEEPEAPEGAGKFHDPHVWVDPVLAGEMVRTIAEALAEIDPDNAGSYETNAEEYADRLAAVDEAFEELVAAADLDVAVLAGHDSFRYVENRYGFEIHTPVAASPEESPSANEIAETIKVVEENGIETVLYDPFEAPEGEVPPLAQTIVENSTATDTAPITPAEGTTAEWAEEGWGWVEQMEEVTLPSLRTALGAE